ncbi:MAG: hypothetical protein JO041_00430 [Acidobacteria bacterium]|nr:hypothetical protein [Acidobacteriota bacterium]
MTSNPPIPDSISERYVGGCAGKKFSVLPLSSDSGFFEWSPRITCYGRSACGFRRNSASQPLYDVAHGPQSDGAGNARLPFDPAEVVHNLRHERYCGPARRDAIKPALRRLYYGVRPFLPVGVRKHVQRLNASGWQAIPFPAWPVDFTVENLLESLLRLELEISGAASVPFVWFWPEGFSACVMLTHDVETAAGRDFCSVLMDVNDRYGVKSAFQVVPEKRYELTPQFVDSLRRRGFELNLHDLNHDGRLFSSRAVFAARAPAINVHLRELGCTGFRSAVLYRNPEWLQDLEIEYDMSVPNVAHLDPQRGGCCTVLPFFTGNIVELPLTTTQDYMLFHLLNDYSMDLWTLQTESILARNGLISLLVHPDYIMQAREMRVYEDLLKRVAWMRSRQNAWVALPKQIAAWWRQRSQMTLAQRNRRWVVEGAGCERARIAWASIKDGRLAYDLECPAALAA